MKCPECGTKHQSQRTSLPCLTAVQNEYILEPLCTCTQCQTLRAEEHKERLDKMKAYMSQLQAGG